MLCLWLVRRPWRQHCIRWWLLCLQVLCWDNRRQHTCNLKTTSRAISWGSWSVMYMFSWPASLVPKRMTTGCGAQERTALVAFARLWRLRSRHMFWGLPFGFVLRTAPACQHITCCEASSMSKLAAFTSWARRQIWHYNSLMLRADAAFHLASFVVDGLGWALELLILLKAPGKCRRSWDDGSAASGGLAGGLRPVYILGVWDQPSRSQRQPLRLFWGRDHESTGGPWKELSRWVVFDCPRRTCEGLMLSGVLFSLFPEI